MPMRLRCPTCKRETDWSDAHPYRPFCSERCRLIDLGAWLGEKHAIAGNPGELGGDEAVPPSEEPSGR
jgi:endogenous inhibitor of DNA gyrase (YacG/DUF329 family)